MSDFASKIAGLSPQKLALLCVELKSALDAQARREAEPIAVIGMGCRMPGGANDPEAFSKLLREGRDATSEVPPDRWNLDEWYDPDAGVAGRMYTRRGGFLERVDGFDHGFFRLSPREAASLDPQQRLLLEVAWEAVEDAGLRVQQLARSRTGVFVGIGVDDYAKRQVRAGSPIDIYSGTGNAFCFASGRLSYFFGLQGPSLSLDTACSSSLVTIHLACQSLRTRDCDFAMAGGVNVMLSPEASVFLSSAKALAPDGRCKTFDAAADGYSRSEGCGMLVLRRLSDAQAANDRILAVIRGSAVNHGGAGSGLTVPNGQAQRDVIRQALTNAGVTPRDIGYVEAHGTGTALGDPIEIAALAEVFGGRLDPLWLGSVKTNIGHLETGAGVASLIKVILALTNEELPPHLHFKKSNPHLSLDTVPARIPVEPTPWRRGERPRMAGISSFGLSGTNAHLVVEEAPAEVHAATRSGGTYRLNLSARTPGALTRMTAIWRDWLQSQAAQRSSVHDICYTAAVRRTRQKQQLVVAGDSHLSLAQRLGEILEGRDPAVPESAITPREGLVVSLPVYPFDRQRCWYEEGDSTFDFVFSRARPSWTADHRIYGQVVFPATGYLSLADRAAREVSGGGSQAVRDVEIFQALLIPEEGNVALRLIVKPGGEFEFLSNGTVHAKGRIEAGLPEASPVQPPVEGESRDSADYYEQLRTCGFEYGPAFQGIRDLRVAGGTHWSRVELPPDARCGGEGFALHPALLDACMQTLGQVFQHLAGEGMAWLPVGLGSFAVFRPGVEAVWCRVEPGSQPGNASLRLFTGTGLPVANLTGLILRRTRREALTAVRTTSDLPDDWLYEMDWTPCPRWQSTPAKLEGHWLIVNDRDRSGTELAARLRQRGATVDVVEPDADFENLRPFSGAVHLAGLDNGDLERCCGSLLRLVQKSAVRPAPIWIVTAGADEAHPMQAPLWGLGRTLALEHPELWGGLIDLDPAHPAATQLPLIEAEITAPDAERQVTFRDSVRLGARLRRVHLPPARGLSIDPGATYLITGGTGSLGRRVAVWLESHGARHIALAGRSATQFRADISQEQDVTALLRHIAGTMPPLKGIIHAAGVVDDGVLTQQTWERFDRVFAPKLRGAYLLDRHTRELPLDFFVLFSAFSTFLGSPGQSSYVAANSYLDSLARNRRARGLPAVSIGWGPFADIGMSARLGLRHGAQRRTFGIGDILPDMGIRILERLIGTDVVHAGVMPIQWNRFLPAFKGLESSLLSGFQAGATVAPTSHRDLAGLETESSETVFSRILGYLQQQIALELRYRAGQLPDPSQSLPELGFDSLLALDLRNRLSRDLGMEIPMRVFYESETLTNLARNVSGHVRTPALRPLTVAPEDALATLHEMPEAELDALLSTLGQGGGE